MKFKAWAVQNSGLRINDAAEKRLLDSLKDTRTDLISFGVIPFTNEITGWEDFPDEVMFPHCSTKALRILTDRSLDPQEIFVGASKEQASKILANLRAGLFYDHILFDQAHYGSSDIKQYLLNGDCEMMMLAEAMNKAWDRSVFIKPTKDLKLFQGSILEPNQSLASWAQRNSVDTAFNSSLTEMIIVAKLKAIQTEWRFFVVDGSPIAWSQYKKGDKILWDSTVPGRIIDEAKVLAKVYAPNKAFTMDLCLLDDEEIKIVEYNCINCSGLYHASITKLVNGLRGL